MTRRGSFAAYLDIDHPDVEEFLQIKDIGNPIQNLFFSVCVPDYWMQEMIDGDVEKRKLWARILESRQQKGLPYIFFTDNNNKNKSQIYKDLDLKITHSNLCLAGNTIIQVSYKSEDGTFNPWLERLDKVIEMLEGGKELYVRSYNTETKSSEFKLITNSWRKGVKEVIRVRYNNSEFSATPDHKFLTESGKWVELIDILNNKLGILNTSDKEYVELYKVSSEETEVYDIEVQDNHNFFVILPEGLENNSSKAPNYLVAHNCAEISIPDSTDESFVCCLSSMNLELYDEWKDTNAVYYAIYFLDAVMSEFIEKTEDNYYLKNSHNFAKRHRALGLGRP